MRKSHFSPKRRKIKTKQKQWFQGVFHKSEQKFINNLYNKDLVKPLRQTPFSFQPTTLGWSHKCSIPCYSPRVASVQLQFAQNRIIEFLQVASLSARKKVDKNAFLLDISMNGTVTLRQKPNTGEPAVTKYVLGLAQYGGSWFFDCCFKYVSNFVKIGDFLNVIKRSNVMFSFEFIHFILVWDIISFILTLLIVIA